MHRTPASHEPEAPPAPLPAFKHTAPGRDESPLTDWLTDVIEQAEKLPDVGPQRSGPTLPKHE
ncbi:MAG: hypothetical protein ACKVI4_08530 [Actinomycetales bacterium]